ncbi:unnamed protein product [Prorocentrum cordatum]|uniref:Uncharacterized protein n=1 Tax=Prorocentrum cordatum TaxID=2364126 RepID=A0ABN9PBQ5_9DINO|nr:unnamed protein product [Polarella glacialis]
MARSSTRAGTAAGGTWPSGSSTRCGGGGFRQTRWPSATSCWPWRGARRPSAPGGCWRPRRQGRSSPAPPRAPRAPPPRGGAWAAPAGCTSSGGEQGVEGWALDRGSVQNRWDALLDGLLQGVMMDGGWPQEVRASVFVGPDTVDLSGQVQEWSMPVVAGRRHGKAAVFQPVTFQSWEDALWWSRGRAGLPGLEWRLAPAAPESLASARRQQLEGLRAELARLPEAAAVLVFTPARPDVSYDQLRDLGERRSPRPGCVYVLMGGAHGFDDSDDRDGAFAAEVLAAFSERFGDDRVVRVSLGAGEPSRDESEPKFTLASVASFVSVEHTRGALRQAIAGVDAYRNKTRKACWAWWLPSLPTPPPSLGRPRGGPRVGDVWRIDRDPSGGRQPSAAGARGGMTRACEF